MSAASYQVYVLNSSMERLAILDDYLSLTWTRRWQQPNSFELHVSRHAKGAEYLVVDNLIQVVRDGQVEFTAVIEHGELMLDEKGKASEVWTCRGGDIITRRICLPPAGLAHDERSGPAETCMKGYVAANVISPTDTDRTISLVTNEADSGRGTNIAVKARYEALANKLEECARAGGIGWELVGTAAGLEFRVVPGVDRSAAQSANPPIIFSPDFGNIRTLGYQWSMLNRATLAYVAGQGEGAARQIEVVYDGASVPTGTARREAFIDARDLDTSDKLVVRGQAKLSEQGPAERLEAQILTGGPFSYRTDWDLGDIVTVRNLDWGVLAHLRISEVTVSLEPGTGEQVQVAFGAPPANLISVIRQGIAASEVVQRSEGGGIDNPMTAAGDIIVGGADGAPTRLAKGAALALLRMNSGATAPEWGSSGQIAFPATQNPSADPNTLDDYEEGTWTPALKFGGADVGMSYAHRSGRYTKLGRFVALEGEFALSAKGSSSGGATILGLPFASSGIYIPSAFVSNLTITGALQPQLQGSTIFLYTQSGGVNAQLQDSNFSDTSQIVITCCYEV